MSKPWCNLSARPNNTYLTIQPTSGYANPKRANHVG